jgi:hypothetical protein
MLRRKRFEAGDGGVDLHERLLSPCGHEEGYQVVVDKGVAVVEIADAMLQVSHALVRFGLTDAAGDMRGIRCEPHYGGNEAAGVKEGALDPGVGECDCSVGDEGGGVGVKEIRVALVEQRVDGVSPLAALHEINKLKIAVTNA